MSATPAQPTNTHARLAQALASMSSPKANKTNPAFRSRYASLDAILDHVRPILAKHGLGLMQHIVSAEGRIGVQTTIVGPEGIVEFAPVTIAMKPESNVQQYNSAVTTLRRMTAQAALGIATDADDDGAAASSQPAPAKKWIPNSARSDA
jgi:hypothetical protein